MNNYIKIIIGITISVLINCIATAQAPGYQGKKLAFEVESAFSIDLIANNFFSTNTNSSNSYADKNHGKNISSFFFRPTISAEYIVSRSISFKGFYRFFGSNINTSSYRVSDVPYLGFAPMAPATMRSNAFGAQIKLYNKNCLAPLGTYGSFSIENISSKLDLDGVFENSYLPPNTHNVIYGTIGAGKNIPLSDALLLDFSANIGFPLNGKHRTSNTITENNWAAHNIENALLNYYLFSFNLGLLFMP